MVKILQSGIFKFSLYKNYTEEIENTLADTNYKHIFYYNNTYSKVLDDNKRQIFYINGTVKTDTIEEKISSKYKVGSDYFLEEFNIHEQIVKKYSTTQNSDSGKTLINSYTPYGSTVSKSGNTYTYTHTNNTISTWIPDNSLIINYENSRIVASINFITKFY